MRKEIMMELDKIQPSQLYINSQKLNKVLLWFQLKDMHGYAAIPVKRLNGKVIYTDGHTRAYAAYLMGAKTIKVCWDEDEMDWKIYQTCVDWCISEGIHSIGDLRSRIIGPEEYEKLWIKRCESIPIHKEDILEQNLNFAAKMG